MDNNEIYINLNDLVQFTMELPETEKYKYDMLHKIYEARFLGNVRVFNSDTGRIKRMNDDT